MYVDESNACAVDGCDDAKDSRGWCRRHYLRWWRTGDPGPAELPRYGLITVCSAEGCERKHRTKGYCDLHYRRWKRGLSPESRKFQRLPSPADISTYAAAHRQLRILRGPASDYTCSCGATARQWAYQHNDPEALTSELGHPYSFKSLQCYAPMCQSCHNLLDRDLDLREAANL